MGLTVRLQDERGKPQCEADVAIEFYVPTGDSSFQLLRYIDPYGNTIFNQLQMDIFLAEWEKMRDEAKNQAEMEAWSWVSKLAQKCKNEPHLYLRFIGD